MGCSVATRAVCDREGNSSRDRNRITIIWPEPDRHLPKLAGFLTGFDIIRLMALSNTIIRNLYSTIL